MSTTTRATMDGLLTVDDPVDPADPDAAATPRRRWWRRNLGLIVVAVVLILLLALTALALRGSSGIALDPRSPEADGSRALAQILGDQGVEVTTVTRLADLVEQAGPGTTVVLVDQQLSLPDDELLAVADSGADLVLPSAGFLTLLALAPEVIATGSGSGEGAESDTVAPGCSDADAAAAGAVTSGGDGLVPDESSESGRTVTVCYTAGSGPYADAGTYATITGDGQRVTVIGNIGVLTNERLADEGNAALALRALGRQPSVLWYLADPLDPALARDSEPTSPGELLPSWVRWVAIQLGVAALVAVVWRYRRLGALVPEGLPAVVRSVETAEGRARLYRRSGSRERAAALLRVEAARRLAQRLGARRGATPLDVARLAATATGRDAVAVSDLLAGPPPVDDTRLVALADDLDALVASLQRA